jgi:tetratricopeptide (TPR) repeat protein
MESIRDALRRLKVRADHPGYQATIDELALSYNADGRKQQALALYEEGIAGWEKIGDPLNPATWLFRHQWTWWKYMETGQEAAAIPHLEKNLRAAATIGQEAATRGSLYTACLKVGRVEDALSHVQKSYEAQLKHYGPDHRSWALGKARAHIGTALVKLKRYAEAEPWLVGGYQELLEYVREQPGYDKSVISTARSTITELYKATNKPDKLIQLEEQQLQHLLDESPLNHLAIRNTTQSLTPAYVAAGQYEKAAQTIERVLAKTSDQQVFEPLSGTLVNLYQALDRLDEVSKWSARRIPLVKQNLQKAQAAAANPTALRNAAHMLTWAYAHSDHKAEAIQQFDESITAYKSKGWPHDKVAVNSIASFCRAVARAGDPERGIEITNLILAELRQLPNPPQDVIAAELYTLGLLLSADGRHDEAEPHLRKALEYQDQSEPQLWNTSRTRLYLATALLAQKKYAEAEPLLLACHAEMLQRIQTAPLWEKQFLQHAANRLIELYTALDKPEQAAKWRAEEAKRGPTGQ